MKLIKKVFSVDNMGVVEDCLGVNIVRDQVKIVLTQPQLIDQIIANAKMSPNTSQRNTPAISSKIPN